MRTIFFHASAALISAAAFTGPTAAAEPLHLTPPLYREQAPAAQRVRRFDILTTTPQPVLAAKGDTESASTARRSLVQAVATAVR